MEGSVYTYACLQAESTLANYSGQINCMQPPAPLPHHEAFQTKAATFSSLFKKFLFSHGILTLTTSCAAEGLDFISHCSQQTLRQDYKVTSHIARVKAPSLSPQSALVPASPHAGEDAPLPPWAQRKGLRDKIIASLLLILAISLLYSVWFIKWVTQNQPDFTRLWSNIPSFTWAVKWKQLIHPFLRGSVLRNKSLVIFHCSFSPCLLFFNNIVCKKQVYCFTSI